MQVSFGCTAIKDGKMCSLVRVIAKGGPFMMKNGFSLASQLGHDTFPIMDLRLSSCRLMNDCRFPWVILVPRIAGVEEIYDLDRSEKSFLMEEMAATAKAISEICNPDKMNVGALGNIVSQLHIHIIARYEDDAAWPDPVWGVGEREPYSDNGEAFLSLLRPQITQEMNQN